MGNKHKGKVVEDAIRRLRQLANSRTITDAAGPVTYEGHLYPVEIREELNKVYLLARAKAKREASNGK